MLDGCCCCCCSCSCICGLSLGGGEIGVAAMPCGRRRTARRWAAPGTSMRSGSGTSIADETVAKAGTAGRPWTAFRLLMLPGLWCRTVESELVDVGLGGDDGGELLVGGMVAVVLSMVVERGWWTKKRLGVRWMDGRVEEGE